MSPSSRSAPTSPGTQAEVAQRAQAEVAQRAEAYFQEHNLLECLQDLLEKAVQDKPADPFKFMGGLARAQSPCGARDGMLRALLRSPGAEADEKAMADILEGAAAPPAQRRPTVETS